MVVHLGTQSYGLIVTWIAFLLAALKALPALIQLIASIKVSADAATNRGVGYDQAVADVLKSTTDRLAIAQQVEGDAAKDHAAVQDDSAFDQDFRRNEP